MTDPFNISIPGLSKNQMYLMDKFWECENEDQFIEWFLGLSEHDRLQVESLQQMVMLAYIDNMVEISDMKEAKSVIHNIGGLDVA